MTQTAVQRPVLDNLKVSLALMSMTGKVMSAVRPKANADEAFKMACKWHPDDPHGVDQVYLCKMDHELEPFKKGDALQAKVDSDGNFIIVPKDAIKAAKENGLPARTLELRSHPYASEATFASGPAYIFVPSDNNAFYAVLLSLVGENGLVETENGARMLVGMYSLRKGSESFVRLERWGDQLVIRELIRPEDLNNFEELDIEAKVKDVEMARTLIDALAEDFNPDEYRAAVRDRLNNLVEQVKSGEVSATSAPAVEEKATEDISAAIAASIAAAKAAKVAA